MRLIDVKNLIVDLFRKRKVFELALANGCYPNGDVVVYKDTIYYVHIMAGCMWRSKLQIEKKNI